MMQKTLLALLFTLFLTGCMERGQNLKPAPVHTTPVKPNPIHEKSKVKSVEFKKSKTVPSPIVSVTIKKTLITKQTLKEIHTPKQVSKVSYIKKKDESIFSLSDETKNKISGFFVLIIGIIILL